MALEKRMKLQNDSLGQYVLGMERVTRICSFDCSTGPDFDLLML